MKIVAIGGNGLVGRQGARCFTMPFNTCPAVPGTLGQMGEETGP